MAVEVKEGQDIKCRYCGAVRRYDKDSDQRDPDYCSGKCRAADERGYSQSGEEPMTREVMQQQEALKAEPDAIARLSEASLESTAPGEVMLGAEPEVASYQDYINRPNAYHRRFDPEKLNWGEHLNLKELQQAGLRANRKPIPGDFDYVDEKPRSELNRKKDKIIVDALAEGAEDAVQGKEEAPA